MPKTAEPQFKYEVRDGHMYAAVAALHVWKDNPKITEKPDMERLKKQIQLGEHSTLLVETDGNVLGGNTRLDAYTKLKWKWAKVIWVNIYQEGERWVADVDGVRAPKTFDSHEQAQLEYALSHNDQIGRTDDTKLAELLTIHPIEMETYKVSTFVKPVEDLAFEVGPAADPEDRDQDVDTTSTDKLDAYMNGTVKQIVLYFDNDQYEDVVPRMEALRDTFGVDNNTDLFLKLLESAENV